MNIEFMKKIPNEDTVATSDDILAIEEGEREYAAGETISLDDFEKSYMKKNL